MKVKVHPSDGLEGRIASPPSKSYTHRYLVAAALSEGETLIEKASLCDDTIATVEACRLFGSKVEVKERNIRVKSDGRPKTPTDVIYCRGSGTTLRFMTALAALAPGVTILTGDDSLRRRPMKPLLEALRRIGVEAYSASGGGYPPIIVFGGGIIGGYTWVDGTISSQYVSGLLLALPKAEGSSILEVKGGLESKGYVDLTVKVLEEFGVKVERTGYTVFHVDAPQSFSSPGLCRVPGDYSSTSFILTAAAILGGSKVIVEGLVERDVQPDRRMLDILIELGVPLRFRGSVLEVEGLDEPPEGFRVDVSDTPDLAPPLTALACFCRGVSRIEGCRRLRFKESDRLKALSSEFRRIGGEVEVSGDTILVYGSGSVEGGYASSWGDHRVAMALAVAGLGSRRGVVIDGFECVSKSYPSFLKDLEALGGRFDVIG